MSGAYARPVVDIEGTRYAPSVRPVRKTFGFSAIFFERIGVLD